MSNKILIIEDNVKNRKILADILVFHKYEVLEAVNGEKGIEIAKEQKPDLILMDIQMPVMDGYAAAKILKSDSGTKHIGIIAITSYAMLGDRQKALDAGMDDYVSKPFNIIEVLGLIKKYLVKSPS